MSGRINFFNNESSGKRHYQIDLQWSRLDEQEFLLPPNTNFRILKIHHFTYPLKIECKAIYN